jgi:hypothetical protein
MALAKHDLVDYVSDTKRLFDILKPLLIAGPGWPFIQPLNKKSSRDGRAAFLAVKRQAEGTSALASRKAASYLVIRKAEFTGRSGAYSLDMYISLHQKAHNELFSLWESPCPRQRKSPIS